MAKRKVKREKKVDTAVTAAPVTPAARVGGDFDLNPEYYDQTASFEVYSTEKKITKIFGLRDRQGTGEPYLKARTRSKTPRGWRFLYGVDLQGSAHVGRFVQGILALAKKLGWQLHPEQDLEKIKEQLRDSEETIVRLDRSNEELRERHEELMVAFRARQEEVLRSRADEFEDDTKKLAELIANAQAKTIPEQDLQEFLYAHPWLFGTEYINAEPQKLRGAHSKFDFYLERFNKTNDIVEIKLPSDQITNRDGSLTARVSQAIDQLIDYMESSQAAAHSTVISEEEGIRELRPRGMVIIGCDSSSEAKKKLHKWNYQFGHITILTYQDLLERARSVLRHLKK